MSEILSEIAAFIRDNNLIAMIIAGLIVAFIVKAINKLADIFWRRAKKSATKWSQRRAKKLLEHYQKEIAEVKLIKDNDPKILFTLIHRLYGSLNSIIMVTIILVLINLFDNELWFYSFLGVGTRVISGEIIRAFYQEGLFEKSKKFESYMKKMDRKIQELHIKTNQVPIDEH
jgi:hypothetical protein